MKIICIGRNYVEHAKEMNSPLPSSPIYFLKPDTSILRTKNFYYPKFTSSLHYECELVIKIEKVGKNIQEKYAHSYYSEFTLGIDFTARVHYCQILWLFPMASPISYILFVNPLL